jgi:uncharacterized protein (UPF0332 family)
MTMGPSPEYVRRQLLLADEALDDARYLLEGHRLKGAVNRAYYAMFYAAIAPLASITSRIPRSHKDAISLFGRHYVLTGKIDRQFATDLRNAYNLRLQSDYGASTEVREEEIRETIDKAEAFVAEVKRLVNEV